jgi:hypothetical protein
MGATRRSHTTDCVVDKLSHLSSFISWISLLLLLNVSPSQRSPTTMAIATRAKKATPIGRATVATTATPVERHSSQHSKRSGQSPHTSNVNILLAKNNRPTTHTDSVLQVLQPRYTTPDVPNAYPEKCSPTTAPGSPTGVDGQEVAHAAPDNDAEPQDISTAPATQPPQSSRSVKISNNVTTGTPVGGISQRTAVSPANTARQSILLSSARSGSSTKDPEDDGGYTSTKDRLREIYDRDQKLYRVFSNDGLKETAYHVIDFAGFYPIWPIVEFLMAPTGASKDKRMALFTRCVSALLGKMLYVDDTAMIAPIDITDDNKAHFIKTKINLPSNFTKLGKHIMISGGSWVFNKKEKGSNDVYGRFRLKSQIPTDNIINRVFSNFPEWAAKTSSESSTKRWRRKHLTCSYLFPMARTIAAFSMIHARC